MGYDTSAREGSTAGEISGRLVWPKRLIGRIAVAGGATFAVFAVLSAIIADVTGNLVGELVRLTWFGIPSATVMGLTVGLMAKPGARMRFWGWQ